MVGLNKDGTVVKFSIERCAEYKLYFQWGGGCDLRGFGPTVSLQGGL